MDESKTLTGGDLWNVLTSPAQRQARTNELFDWGSGALSVRIAARFSLADGAAAGCCYCLEPHFVLN